ncbi:hypothetical protein, partial [Nonomuraea sp. NPDC059022]|uniref:hypothetical protein n=1 Tax=Nonomuraea sp. NPDC059022 TaxID=3346705 RepID=UPI0036A455A0
MDLRFRDAQPTDEERAAVDALLGPPATAWDGGDRTAADLRFAARPPPARGAKPAVRDRHRHGGLGFNLGNRPPQGGRRICHF